MTHDKRISKETRPTLLQPMDYLCIAVWAILFRGTESDDTIGVFRSSQVPHPNSRLGETRD